MLLRQTFAQQFGTTQAEVVAELMAEQGQTAKKKWQSATGVTAALLQLGEVDRVRFRERFDLGAESQVQIAIDWLVNLQVLQMPQHLQLGIVEKFEGVGQHLQQLSSARVAVGNSTDMVKRIGKPRSEIPIPAMAAAAGSSLCRLM